ncbi:MAG: hypothetical protein GKC04_05990 [Methanomicrobiales archaeon]|nr:hypothetical protein [Methanomicrobiales archaeon]
MAPSRVCPVQAAIPAALLLFCALLAAGCTDAAGPPGLPADGPAPAATTAAGGASPQIPAPTPVPAGIVPCPAATPAYTEHAFSTRFEDDVLAISVRVNESIRCGAALAGGAWPAGASWDDDAAIRAYYAGYIDDPAMQAFFDDLMAPFQHLRYAQPLSDQEYLELIITFVQQIPYDAQAPPLPRYPVGVIAAETGDCDEKSLLLLGMLAHEGYDVALIIFPGERHAAAGIRITPSGNPPFRVFATAANGKYFFIETTAPTYIGLYPDRFADAEARVLPIGDGDKRFDRVNYLCFITDSYNKIRDRLVFMADQMDAWKGEIDSLASRLQYGTYESKDEWDADYARYSQLIGKYNSYVEKYNTYREMEAYIREHPHDIAGTYRRIENSKVMEITI